MQDRRHETAQGLEYGLGMLVTGWFAKNLGDAMLATEALDQIRSTYAAVYEEAGARLSAAVFIRHESEGRLHCEVMAYFSPEAFRLAEAFDAVHNFCQIKASSLCLLQRLSQEVHMIRQYYRGINSPFNIIPISYRLQGNGPFWKA